LGLPTCSTANGCFKKIYASEIYASGSKPKMDPGWALEIALDVQWAHVVAPAAKIILVEARTSSFSDLTKAADVAVQNGAAVAGD
jgi:subtilase family serine protease